MDQWIYFLKNEEIPAEFTARGLAKAKEQLDILKLSEVERQAYERYQEDLHFQASMVESTYGIGKLEGREEGREEGRKEGRKEGERIGAQRGKQEGEANVLLRQLKRRFGQVPAHIAELVATADLSQLEAWTDRILDAKTLDDIFAN
ncbi:MAG: DUF4351 domain-containing protein [Magnetococcales bacterium]|nr:DUF4351 domain-containing protein [Magnetococcales bacterium]MBF0115943.1 DUF4351 domain-containing protein [Magnetococcales bacterium]